MSSERQSISLINKNLEARENKLTELSNTRSRIRNVLLHFHKQKPEILFLTQTEDKLVRRKFYINGFVEVEQDVVKNVLINSEMIFLVQAMQRIAGDMLLSKPFNCSSAR